MIHIFNFFTIGCEHITNFDFCLENDEYIGLPKNNYGGEIHKNPLIYTFTFCQGR